MTVKDRSPIRIVHSHLDLKTWLARTPTADEARPGQCPACQAPGRPLGERLGLWGHGLRQRQQRGPLEPEGPSQTVVLSARRYLCTRCRALVLVVPRGVMPRRHYAAAAIALALFLYGFLGLPLPEVRRRVSPWRVVGAAAATGWATLVRWVGAARRGALFCCVRPCPKDFSLRQVAQRAAATLCAFALPGEAAAGTETAAFYGGMRMA